MILERINGPGDLKGLAPEQLEVLAGEVRDLIVDTVSKTGGHLASSLGAVELAVALHATFDSPNDKIIWDVGHQAYAHKILTGRRDRFHTLRQSGGISGFLKRDESAHDIFGAGHSSTSVSAALGLATARDLAGESYDVVAVIGDGAMSAGMAFEAVNHAGHLKRDLIVILNDNEMSISQNVGALAGYLSRLRLDPGLGRLRDEVRAFVRQFPLIGRQAFEAAEYLESHLAYFLVPGALFEVLGFTYLGPFDGHDIGKLMAILKKARKSHGPRLIHVLTKKGHGYIPAEQDATRFHGTVPFDIETGESQPTGGGATYTDVFGSALLDLASRDQRIVAVTAAMCSGTGLDEFARKFPERFFDVGIAEQHAVTFAAAMALGGRRPVVAIYSTFIQRAYDQVIHDLCLQNLPVVLALDRAGSVGADGATHQGLFDISFLRAIPNLVIMAPADGNELRNMLYTALNLQGPTAIRYPRERVAGLEVDPRYVFIEPGRGRIIQEGDDLAILALGSMVNIAREAGEELAARGVRTTVADLRFIKPLDENLILSCARRCHNLITIEDNVAAGGVGTSVMELLQEHELEGVRIRTIGFPDCFVEHGTIAQTRAGYGLSVEGILTAAARLGMAGPRRTWVKKLMRV